MGKWKGENCEENGTNKDIGKLVILILKKEKSNAENDIAQCRTFI